MMVSCWGKEISADGLDGAGSVVGDFRRGTWGQDRKRWKPRRHRGTEARKFWSARAGPRFWTRRHVAEFQSSDVPPHSKMV